MPYKSEAQRRFFHANEAKLRAQGVDVSEWDRSSKGKKIPEKVKKEAAHYDYSKLLDKMAERRGVTRAELDKQTAELIAQMKTASVVSTLAPVASLAQELRMAGPESREKPTAERLADIMEARQELEVLPEEKSKRQLLKDTLTGGLVGGLTLGGKSLLAAGGSAAPAAALAPLGIGAGVGAAAGLTSNLLLRLTAKKRKQHANELVRNAYKFDTRMLEDPAIKEEANKYRSGRWGPLLGAELGASLGSIGGGIFGGATTPSSPKDTPANVFGAKMPFSQRQAENMGWYGLGAGALGAGVGLLAGILYRKHRRGKLVDALKAKLKTASIWLKDNDVPVKFTSSGNPSKSSNRGLMIGQQPELYAGQAVTRNDVLEIGKPEKYSAGKKVAAEVVDKLVGGRADGVSAKEFPAKEVIKGSIHETEHSSDPQVALETAKDHIAEDTQYYDKLEKMEKEAANLSGLGRGVAKAIKGVGAELSAAGRLANQGPNVSTAAKSALRPGNLALDALSPVPITGPVNFAKDAIKYNKAGPGATSLTNSAVRNVAIPTATGSGVVPWLQNLWESRNEPSRNGALNKVWKKQGANLSWLGRGLAKALPKELSAAGKAVSPKWTAAKAFRPLESTLTAPAPGNQVGQSLAALAPRSATDVAKATTKTVLSPEALAQNNAMYKIWGKVKDAQRTVNDSIHDGRTFDGFKAQLNAALKRPSNPSMAGSSARLVNPATKLAPSTLSSTRLNMDSGLLQKSLAKMERTYPIMQANKARIAQNAASAAAKTRAGVLKGVGSATAGLSAAGATAAGTDLNSVPEQSKLVSPVWAGGNDAPERKVAAVKDNDLTLRHRAEAIVTNDKGVLAIKKDGYLLLPGGGLNEGESAEEAVCREAIEEADRSLDDVTKVDSTKNLFDPSNILSKGFDGQETEFFTATASDKLGVEHEDNEDFEFIPFDEAIDHLLQCMSDEDNSWDLANNSVRLDQIVKAKPELENTVTKKEAAVIANAPGGGATTKDGSDVVIDPAIPHEVETRTGKDVDVVKSISHHESKERSLMDSGLPYSKAHEKAEEYENAKLKQEQGLETKDIQSYQAQLRQPLEEAKDHKADSDIDPRVNSVDKVYKQADAPITIPKSEYVLFTKDGKLIAKRRSNRRFDLPEMGQGRPAPYEPAIRYLPTEGVPEQGVHGYDIGLRVGETEQAPEGYEAVDPQAALKDMYASMGMSANRQYQGLDRARARVILRALKQRKPTNVVPEISSPEEEEGQAGRVAT